MVVTGLYTNDWIMYGCKYKVRNTEKYDGITYYDILTEKGTVLSLPGALFRETEDLYEYECYLRRLQYSTPGGDTE